MTKVVRRPMKSLMHLATTHCMLAAYYMDKVRYQSSDMVNDID